ncbi:nucleotide-diphospho-sugar transferase [Rickenella mellea]|uniref:Nucleotide-diphospho-sugar transferase n=1 Tax=Rickenella mellea TaxID=50990 RepID=A0A4Y7QLZ8_9AGAM|nr:nucleotide-diphospho-sugar transferase [Rickenella mellea]
MTISTKKAWVTLLTNANYLPGALVLDHTLKSVHSKYPLVVMTTPNTPSEARRLLEQRGIIVRDVDFLVVQSCSAAFKRFSDVWTKLRVFELYEYERVVMLDSDMILRKNMDELLDMYLEDGWIASAHVCACNPRKIPSYPPDWIPANCPYTNSLQPAPMSENSPGPYYSLNSGTVVLTPSKQSAQAVARFIAESSLVQNFRFPDQDLLSHVFKGKWRPLLYHYNALKTLRVVHSNLWQDDEVKCLHYILDKPWSARPGTGQAVGDYEALNQWWWDAFESLRTDFFRTSDSETARRNWELIEANVATV